MCELHQGCEQAETLFPYTTLFRALSDIGCNVNDFNIILNIGSTEGIKRFLERVKNCFGIVSVISVINEIKSNKIKIIDIEGLDINREFSFVSRHGGTSERVDKFINFANNWLKNDML